MVVSRPRDEKLTAEAWKQDAVVLGYDIHGKPWYWPDRVRVMQGIVLGMTGSGKTTLLKNIITQDLARVVGTPNDPHRMPMVIFDEGHMRRTWTMIGVSVSASFKCYESLLGLRETARFETHGIA
jgi:hypothetical protein